MVNSWRSVFKWTLISSSVLFINALPLHYMERTFMGIVSAMFAFLFVSFSL